MWARMRFLQGDYRAFQECTRGANASWMLQLCTRALAKQVLALELGAPSFALWNIPRHPKDSSQYDSAKHHSPSLKTPTAGHNSLYFWTQNRQHVPACAHLHTFPKQ